MKSIVGSVLCSKLLKIDSISFHLIFSSIILLYSILKITFFMEIVLFISGYSMAGSLINAKLLKLFLTL